MIASQGRLGALEMKAHSAAPHSELDWVFWLLRHSLDVSPHTASPNSPNGFEGNQRPPAHWVCRGHARAVVGVQSQNKL